MLRQPAYSSTGSSTRAIRTRPRPWASTRTTSLSPSPASLAAPIGIVICCVLEARERPGVRVVVPFACFASVAIGKGRDNGERTVPMSSNACPTLDDAGASTQRAIIDLVMTAKEMLLQRAPLFTESQATAALRVVEAQAELASYFEQEAQLSSDELDAREDAWAQSNAREAIREEPW